MSERSVGFEVVHSTAFGGGIALFSLFTVVTLDSVFGTWIEWPDGFWPAAFVATAILGAALATFHYRFEPRIQGWFDRRGVRRRDAWMGVGLAWLVPLHLLHASRFALETLIEWPTTPVVVSLEVLTAVARSTLVFLAIGYVHVPRMGSQMRRLLAF